MGGCRSQSCRRCLCALLRARGSLLTSESPPTFYRHHLQAHLLAMSLTVIYLTSFHYTGSYELHKLTSLPMCGFIAQLVEHRTGIAEVTGSNPVEALIFSGFFPVAQIGKFTVMITLHFHLQPQYKYELFHIYPTSFHYREDMNSIN